MAAMTDFLENKVVDFLFRAQALTAIGGATAAAGTGPPTLWVGLFTAAPNDAGGGTEVSGNAYARVSITSSAANWAATNGATTTTNPSTGTGGATSNNEAINFPTPDPAGWGSVSHFGIFDAVSAGNLLFYGEITGGAKTVNAADTVSFAISALSITWD